MVDCKDVLIFDMPLDQTFAFCLERLKGSPRFRLQTVLTDSKAIKLRTGISWKTFGDEITLTFESLNLTRTSITMVSRTNGLQIVDYGSNKNNIRQIKQILHDVGHELLRPSHKSEAGERELLRPVLDGNGDKIDSLLRAFGEDNNQ